MDEVARLKASDREDLFRATATRRRLTSQIIEKDFWVCWALRRIFTLPHRQTGILFKGGTSLSKAFGLIERFSEDVDLSLDRSALGFGGENDPLVATSGKKKKHGLEALATECQRVIREEFHPELIEAFTASLGAPPSSEWGLEIAPDDDGQTLRFRYPSVHAANPNLPAYVQPVVRLELGARSDHWPAVDASVTPYAAETFQHAFKDATTAVRVLSVARTFWEKATILHMWHHATPDRHFRDRQSRHYYDFAKLWQHEEGKRAAQDVNLLARVAQHKHVFFSAAWAQYDLAKPGTLKLVPPDSRIPELEEDYRKMQEMIFGIAPAFQTIIDALTEAEEKINEARQ